MMPCGINGDDGFSNDLIKSCAIYAGSSHSIAAANLTVSGAVSFKDATLVGLTTNGIPTTFPSDGSSLILFLNSTFAIPAHRFGTWDVTFTPGLDWSFTGGASATRTTYNSAAGTATVVITSSVDHISFTLTSYNGVSRTLPAVGDFYFRAFKQGADTSKLVAQEYKDALAPFAGGHIRMMTPGRINRPAITGVTYGALNEWLDNDSLTWQFLGSGPPPEVLIEIAEDCGMIPWDNIYDLASDEAITDRATRVLAAMPPSMALYVEDSNELWNFGPGFSQSSALNTRATAAGVSQIIQHARELKPKIELYEAVFSGQLSRLKPVIAWQSSITAMQIGDALNEGNLYQKIYGFAIAPYVGGGIGGYDIGNYSVVLGFPTVSRDLILTNAAAFKTAAFACHDAALDATMTAWASFVNNLRDYCVSKGLARTAIRPMTYEHAPQHIIEQNTPTGSDQKNLTRTAFAEMLRDPRMGALAVEQIKRLSDAGADLCFFTLSSKAVAASMSFGVWGTMDTISDTGQEPYASIAAYLTAAPEPEARPLSAQGVLS